MLANFLGCPYPIQDDPFGYLHTQSDVNQIKSDLLILLLTNPGERCLTADTKIPLANGTESTIKDLVGKPPFWVYSFDKDLNAIVPGMATAYKTLENAELMEITLDNQEKVRCTPDHLWLLRNGEYCRADNLCIGDSLMPLYRHLNTSKYERIYQPYLHDYRETHLCFVFDKRETGIREVVHHKDLNKNNNAPDNLQWMTCKDHKALHKEINNAFIYKLNNDPKFKEEWLQKAKAGLEKYYETHDGPRKNAVLSKETKQKLSERKKNYFKTDEGMACKEILRKKALKQSANGGLFKGHKHTNEAKAKMRKSRLSMDGENNPSKRLEVREKLKAAWVERRKQKQNELKNHKVVAIRKLDVKEDCYDLKVEKYHNFALSAGVFVHNCMLPTFGTPLRTLFFEPNDTIIINQATQMIANAISTWEPRVAISAINVSTGTGNLNPKDFLIPNTPTGVGMTGGNYPYSQNDDDHCLSIQIKFFDPENIQSVQELVFEVPL